MSKQITVYVIDKKRRCLYMRYTDPATYKPVERSTGASNKKEAEKAANKWEAELQEGRYAKPSRMSWEAFRAYYREHAYPGLADKSVEAYESALNVFQKLCNPQKLADVTTTRVTGFVTEMRKLRRSEATVACHLRHLKAAMRWANGEGLLPVLPKFTMPKRIKGSKDMRGRPITTEEFERMLEAVPAITENVAAESWKFYLRGLWESSLRLNESLHLRWDAKPGVMVVDLTGRRPMLRIPAEAHKGNRDTLLPITPEFAALLQTVPERERRGHVFKLIGIDGSPMNRSRSEVGKMISAIGEKAGVVVDERERDGETIRKYASAHDLRRAFGQRWAGRVMPDVLRQLMRHRTVETTMKFYVGHNAELIADAVWAAVGDTLGDTPATGENATSKAHAK